MIIQINLIMIINIFNKAKIAITYTLQNYNSNYQKQLLKQVISYRKVKNFLLKNFKLLPFLFNEQIIQKYFQCDKLPVYAKYISKMNQKMQSQKLNSLQKQMFMISPRFFQAKSLIETYLDFLHTYFEEQVLRSNVLFQYSDIKNPQQWYFKTRKLTRKIIYNHGPTNSGKTSYALEQLKNAKIGIYMAPLRLLAWQTQQILLPCNLITGQQKLHMNSGLTSCTIQTTDFKKQYDVAVIDQIQMIADPERGWGWTQALLRIKAKVLHVCGNQRALELIEKLLKNTSDSLQQKKYSRLSKLKLINDKYVLQKDLQKGDCIIAFSAEKLFSIRKRINSIIKKKKNSVAIIYGKLPPQIRKIQAHLFNQGKLPYLVATNAIGMD